MTADLACGIADGARVISDFRTMPDQRELFGPAASLPTAWRTLAEIARGGTRTDKRITQAANTAWRRAGVLATARHGALPGVGWRTVRARFSAHGPQAYAPTLITSIREME